MPKPHVEPKYLHGCRQVDRTSFKTLDDRYNATDGTFCSHSLELLEREGNPYIYKLCRKDKTTKAQIEAALGDLYRFLLGPDRSPEMMVVCQDGEVQGVASKVIPGFKSFYQRIVEEGWRPSVRCLAEAGLGSLAAAGWMLQEKDMSWRNFGFNADGKLVKIDHDKGLAGIAKPIRHPHKDVTELHENMSVISITDMEQLLLPLRYRPTFWFHNYAFGDVKADYVRSLLATIEQDDIFCFDKWKTMVKATMLTKPILRAIFSAQIKDTGLVERLVDYVHQRIVTIMHALTTIETAIEAIGKNYHDLLAKIEQEVQAYNDAVSGQFEPIPSPYHMPELSYLQQMRAEYEVWHDARLRM